ncbi:MAG TPA: ribonuclease P protein component [Candidatus Saccharimonadales bacterium]|nr:ribonuclease P protein component [Candidatus Saccharimonadales bacterium]
MLKKENRIGLNKEFDRAFKAGQSFYGKILGIKCVPNDRINNRFGILINTKVSKKAVVRNKIRREIREIIKKRLESLKPGNDFVIIVFPLILDKNNEEIASEIDFSLKKLRVLK